MQPPFRLKNKLCQLEKPPTEFSSSIQRDDQTKVKQHDIYISEFARVHSCGSQTELRLLPNASLVTRFLYQGVFCEVGSNY